jgi:drug/metabolite transporter (DMT)-like permease
MYLIAGHCSIQFRIARGRRRAALGTGAPAGAFEMDSNVAKTYNALAAGIVAISFGAIFTRLAHAPAPGVAALRMIFSSIILVPFVLGSARARRELRELSRGDLLLLVLSGLFLALHFMLWILSLSYTGVASSVVLVTTNPLWVALFTIVFLKEKVSRIIWLGLALSIAGGVIIGGSDALSGHERWQGDMLALGGALAIAGYFIVGSRLRKRLSLIAYVFPVYSVAAAALLAVSIAARVSLAGFEPESYLYCFLMAFVCQILGHSLFNWALEHLAATVVSIAVLGEPVGASILAVLILREVPGSSVILGGALILMGIFLVLYASPESAAARERIASGS